MSKGLNRILDFMKLNDNEFEDEGYDEVEDSMDEDMNEEPVKKKAATKKPSRFKKRTTEKLDDDEMDDIYDDVEDVASDRAKSKNTTSSHRSTPFSRNNNIVPLRTVSSHSAPSMEVCVSKPIDFNTSQEISDILLSGKAAIINFDGVTSQEAQRIIDFVSGACYAVNGSAKQISNTIVIVTPSNIDITGDLQEMAASSSVDIPYFGYSEEDEEY